MTKTARSYSGSFLLLTLLSPLALEAQQASREPVSHLHVISGSPLLLLADGFNAEYERRLNGAMTAGIAGGWLDLDDEDYTSVTGFLRFYPQNAALTGYYLGARSGFVRVDDGSKTSTAFGVGVDVGYAWLLGPSRSFYVGLGLGAVRLIVGDVGGASKGAPQIRLLDLGIAF